MRGKSHYLIDVCPVDDGGETLTYGPYTYRQALEVVKRINRFYRKEAVALDIDPEDVEFKVPHVFWYRVTRWSTPVIHSAPKRPKCPSCGVKMSVWTSEHGDEETYGVCNNKQCKDGDSVDYILVERDGDWVVTNP